MGVRHGLSGGSGGGDGGAPAGAAGAAGAATGGPGCGIAAGGGIVASGDAGGTVAPIVAPHMMHNGASAGILVPHCWQTINVDSPRGAASPMPLRASCRARRRL
jgi:hypothetical protein